MKSWTQSFLKGMSASECHNKSAAFFLPPTGGSWTKDKMLTLPWRCAEKRWVSGEKNSRETVGKDEMKRRRMRRGEG